VLQALAVLLPRKQTRYPLDRRLGGYRADLDVVVESTVPGMEPRSHTLKTQLIQRVLTVSLPSRDTEKRYGFSLSIISPRPQCLSCNESYVELTERQFLTASK
jgi:hypothetical protein